MNKKTFLTKGLSEVDNVANYILDNLTLSKIILLDGELGAGKTTLVKSLAKKMGIKEVISSPTFNYMKTYPGLIHIDAYQLKSDLAEFEDYYLDNIIAIEWANKIDHNYKNYLKVNIKIDQNNSHIFEILKIE